jgi:hypothetical protein
VRIRIQVRPGVVTKRVRLVLGHTVLYCSHAIESMDGPMCFGHHAMRRFPDAEGTGRIASSGFRFGNFTPWKI